MRGKRITVLGAGAVGVCIALYLQRDGHEVRLIDQDEPANGCSFGNAGMIQCSSVVPVAMPGILRAVPKMLLSPDQPLVIRWQHLLSLMPYLWGFIRQAQAGRAAANARALAAVIPGSLDAYQPLIEAAGLESMLRRAGELYVYESEAAYRAVSENLAMRRAHGVEVYLLQGEEIRQMEPALRTGIRHGVFLPNSYQCSNPHRFISTLARHFIANGGQFVKSRLDDIEPLPSGGFQLQTDQRTLEAESIVLAFGAFSGRFAKKLGAPVPLNSERGYHIMLPRPGLSLRHTILSGDYRFAISSMEHGIRVAGTAELARVGAPPNHARASRLLPLAQRLLPGLATEGAAQWMGHRPSMPDSLPVIGRSPIHPEAIFAFGHGHSGLTLGGATGRMVADIVANRPSPVDLTPYGAERFG